MDVNQMDGFRFESDHISKETLLSAAFQVALRTFPDMVFVKDTDLKYVAASDSFIQALHREHPDEVLGRTERELRPAEGEVSEAAEKQLLSSGQNLVNAVEIAMDQNGKIRYLSTSKFVILDDNRQVIGLLGIQQDVTRKHIIRQHYEQALQMLIKLPEQTYAAIILDVDDWRIIGTRAQFVRGDTMPAFRNIDTLCQFLTGDPLNTVGGITYLNYDLSQNGLQKIYRSGQSTMISDCRRQLARDEVRWVRNKIRMLVETDSGHLCAIITIEDIDEQKKAEEELAKSVTLDRMTMVLNREATMRRIRETLTTQPDQIHGFFILDMDNFKTLNDTYGHQAGDEFLIQLGQVLKGSFRENDVVGRIGGDEFFVLMKAVSNIQMIEHRTKQVLDNINVLSSQYPTLPLSASIGIALYPDHGKTLEELYEKADVSLYRVKKSGKNHYAIFESVPQHDIYSTEASANGRQAMTMQEFYAAQGGDYTDVIGRLHSEEIALKFLIRFMEDSTFARLKQAIREENQPDAFAIVHTFKGSCINMGLGKLASSASLLTEAVRVAFMPEAPQLFEAVMSDYENAIDNIAILKASYGA